MSLHLAVGSGFSFQGLHRIARLKGLSLIEGENRVVLGPAEDHELLSTVLLWNKLRPDLSRMASFTLYPLSLQRELAPIGMVAWSGISVKSRLARSLELEQSGAAYWDELEQALSARKSFAGPTPFFGRESCQKRVLEVLSRSQEVILDGQPGIGRTTFAKAFAASVGSTWVDGVSYIDFASSASDDEAAKVRLMSPWDLARDWRSRHQLIILDHVDGSENWISEVIRINSRQGSLSSLLILPAKGGFQGSSGRTVLPPLEFEAFDELWRHYFDVDDKTHIKLMASYLGRMPGAASAIKRILGRQSLDVISKEVTRTLDKFPNLLDKLSERIAELNSDELSMLRHICSFSTQVSLSLATQGSLSEAKALAIIASLIDKGWIFVEDDGYRVPNPLLMAVRKWRPYTEDDWIKSVTALVKEAQSLSQFGHDLAPTRHLSAFRKLIRTGYDALDWVCQQDEHIDLTLEVVSLFWVSALTEGYSNEFLLLTNRLYRQLDSVPISSKTVLYWEARGRHMRTKGLMAESLEAHARGLREALAIGDKRGAQWNLHFKCACLSLMARRQEADDAYEELIPAWRKHGSQKDIAYGLITLCLHFFRYRQFDLMPDVLVEAFSSARKSDEIGLLSSVKELQGWLAHAEGDYERSIELMDEAEVLALQTKSARRDIIGLGRALAYWLTGDRQGAITELYRMMQRPDPVEALSRLSLELHLSQMELMFGDLGPGLERTKILNQQLIDYRANIWMGDLMDLNALAAYRQGHFSSAAILAGCGFHWHTAANRGNLEIEKEVRFWMPECRERLGGAAFQARFQAGAQLDTDKLLSLAKVDYALISQMLPDFFESDAAEKPLLSARQKDVVRLAGEGLSNKKISEALFLEEGTVKRHLHNAAQELGVKGRMALVRKAKDLGLIP